MKQRVGVRIVQVRRGEVKEHALHRSLSPAIFFLSLELSQPSAVPFSPPCFPLSSSEWPQSPLKALPNQRRWLLLPPLLLPSSLLPLLLHLHGLKGSLSSFV